MYRELFSLCGIDLLSNLAPKMVFFQWKLQSILQWADFGSREAEEKNLEISRC